VLLACFLRASCVCDFRKSVVYLEDELALCGGAVARGLGLAERVAERVGRRLPGRGSALRYMSVGETTAADKTQPRTNQPRVCQATAHSLQLTPYRRDQG
jgi:hypothetical protein